MSRKSYRTIADVLASPWATASAPPEISKSDRVLRATKLDDSIYADLRIVGDVLSEIEQKAGSRLQSFPALARDVYQSVYSLMPKWVDEGDLSASARKFNEPILKHMMENEEYSTLKSVCEGKALPAYEAAVEFASRIAENLDELLSKLSGDPGAVNTLEKLESAQAHAQSELAALLEQMRSMHQPNELLEQSIIAAANTVESKRKQVEAVSKMIDASLRTNNAEIVTDIALAVSAAHEKAEEVQSILAVWSGDARNMDQTEYDMLLLELVEESNMLKDVAKYLGRFREIFAQSKRNSYAYGRGETYALELGNNLTRIISSELSLLATPETIPLFLQKYQRKQLKQYQRREPIYKGSGDIICCLDESDSTEGDPIAWGKAVAMTLLDIAADGKRKFALIHFSSRNKFETDVFLPGEWDAVDRMRAADNFMGGGTDFETPMREAVRLMEQESFEQADIVFITDGRCELPEEYLKELQTEQAARNFTVTGILLDVNDPGMEFSLERFCQDIYRTSELLGDEIVTKLVTARQ